MSLSDLGRRISVASTRAVVLLIRGVFYRTIRNGAWASWVIANGRRCKNPRNLARLHRAFWILVIFALAEGLNGGSTFQMLGAFRGLRERGESFDDFAARWFDRIESWFRTQPDRSGWNDYYMALWFVTGDWRYARTIYLRAAESLLDAGPERCCTILTARWMVDSVRHKHRDFDRAISEIEALNGALPAPMTLDPLAPLTVDA